MKHQLMEFSVEHPRKVFFLSLLFTVIAALFIPNITIDTDPENMLPENNPARVLHDDIKQRFGLSDMIVLGIVNEKHPQGIYNPQTLSRLHELSVNIKNIEGVIVDDLMSLETTDNISQKGPGEISFSWMMDKPPENQQQAMQIAEAVSRLPMVENTLVSGDNKAAGIYIPIVSKDQSYRIYQEILALVEQMEPGNEQYHITGLPVAEDTFGVEMFKQMAISAPAAGALIFVMMLFFFRSVPLVIAPMIVAMTTVIITMGALIGLGFSVHIMSSMIPIFLMPIAVVDSVHILSEFSDRYRPGTDKKQLAREVINNLFQPMLFTSITSMVGFASLNTADIPPVKVFGSFIAFGIALAFLLSITLVPAYMASLSDKTLEKMANKVHGSNEGNSLLARFLRHFPALTTRYNKLVLIAIIAIMAISSWGIQKIVINDNPVNWFEEDHPIRQADNVLNQHFAGTYEAFLTLEYKGGINKETLLQQSEPLLQTAPDAVSKQWQSLVKEHANGNSLNLQALNVAVMDTLFEADDDSIDSWEKLASFTETTLAEQQYFLQPENLQQLEKIQQALMSSGLVGKTSALPDLLKTVNRELRSGKPEDYTLPASSNAVAQSILTYQSSHNPEDVWHMVTPNYQSSIIWLQLKSGDNQDMSRVHDFMEQWFADNPLPASLEYHWSGLTYINVIWQDAMVSGMLYSLLSSFVIVALMMMILFRSIAWGLIAMIPLTVTISFIYGLIGITGKNYDMPVAVLSALTLGMSIDFAIHFIERTRHIVAREKSWSLGIKEVFEEPGRAISRNALVIAFGFTPLLLAPLIPYQTVGIFLASIMAISCITTLLVLPAIIDLFQGFLFKGTMTNKGES